MLAVIGGTLAIETVRGVSTRVALHLPTSSAMLSSASVGSGAEDAPTASS